MTGKSRLYFFLIILILLIPAGYLIFGNRHPSKKIGNADSISSSPSTKPETSKIPVNTTPLPSNTGLPHQKSQTSDIPPAFWDLFKQKEYDRAAGILEESLKEKPDNFEILKFLADCYYLSGKTGKAYITGKKLLALQPGNPDVHILMGNIYLYRKKNGGEAIKYYRQALRLRPGDRSTALNLMEAYFLKKDIPSVISFLEKYLPDNPGDARAMIILGEAYIESGRLKDAQEIIKKALKIEPDDAVNWVLLAEAYMDNKEFDESMKALEMARSIDPNNKDVYLDIGEIYYWRGDYKTAEKLIKKSLSMDPSYFSPYNELGNLYYLQEKYDLAEKYHKLALERFPRYHDAYRGLGKIYIKQKRYKQAEEAFLKALTYKTHYQGEVCVRLALLYEETNDPVQQEKYLLHGIKTDPNYKEPYVLLMEFYIKKNMKNKAREIEALMKKNCSPGKATSKTGQ